MTAKQLAQRLGAGVKNLQFDFDGECRNCHKIGGSSHKHDCKECVVTINVRITNDEAGYERKF